MSSSDTMQNMYIEPLTFDIFIRKLGQPQNRPCPAIGAEYHDYVHMYTDGSVEGGQGKGGGACVTRIEGNEIIRRKAAGNNCNSFKAETVAMIEAVKLIKNKSLKKVKIWTDSKALTEALSNFKVNRDSNSTELKKLLSEEAEKADIAICKIPDMWE